MEALINFEPRPPVDSQNLQTDLAAVRDLLEASGDPETPLEIRRWLELAEAWYITRTLRAVRGNRSEAARVLGIGRRTLYAKMQKLGIEASWRLAPER